jgi:hypothetical protein
MALIGSSIDPSLFVNDYSGFAKAGAIQGQATAQMGKDIGDAATTGMAMFKEMKAQEGQTNAFGKSMDAMAKAFPNQADMFQGAKMDVMDPNASLIERVSRMNQFQETLKMVQQQQTMNINQQTMDMNQQYKNHQMSTLGGAGAAAKPDARSNDALP